MAKIVISALGCKPNGIYIDATLGGGGHAQMILEASSPNGFLLGIDRDNDTLTLASEALKEFGSRVKIVQGDFKDLNEICEKENISKADGILMDLGISSIQLEKGSRGFSFRRPEEPLDMRMDKNNGITAAEVLNHFPERKIQAILRQFGEERWASRIAKEIVITRKHTPFRKVEDLIQAVKRAIPAKARHGKRHMATKTFQALRIYVNNELEALEKGLRAGLHLLAPAGRMAVISFHSLEDRIVKQTFREAAKSPKTFGAASFRIITRRPATPAKRETDQNPRARSAKLRVIEKEESA